MDCFLIKPHSLYRKSYVQALHEGFCHGSELLKSTEQIKDIDNNFEQFRNGLHVGTNIVQTPDGPYLRAPSNMFWLVQNKTFIGSIDIRANLDHDILSSWGGHIGYGIRPSAQGKGYAKYQLALGLDLCRGMGMGVVRIGCNANNESSKNVIVSNGGVLIRYYEDRLLFEINLRSL